MLIKRKDSLCRAQQCNEVACCQWNYAAGGGGGGRPGIGGHGGFDSSHCPVVGTFDRFNGFCSNILLTFSYYFDNPQMPWGGHLNRNSQLRSNALPVPSLPPSSLTLIGALLPATKAKVLNRWTLDLYSIKLAVVYMSYKVFMTIKM